MLIPSELLQVRYNCVSFHHCRICMTDFKEGGRGGEGGGGAKSLSQIGLKIDRTGQWSLKFFDTLINRVITLFDWQIFVVKLLYCSYFCLGIAFCQEISFFVKFCYQIRYILYISYLLIVHQLVIIFNYIDIVTSSQV